MGFIGRLEGQYFGKLSITLSEFILVNNCTKPIFLALCELNTPVWQWRHNAALCWRHGLLLFACVGQFCCLRSRQQDKRNDAPMETIYEVCIHFIYTLKLFFLITYVNTQRGVCKNIHCRVLWKWNGNYSINNVNLNFLLQTIHKYFSQHFTMRVVQKPNSFTQSLSIYISEDVPWYREQQWGASGNTNTWLMLWSRK